MASLGINADLLQQAKQVNINILQTQEQHLAKIVRQEQRSQWLAEYKGALDEYNLASNRAARSVTACGGSNGETMGDKVAS